MLQQGVEAAGTSSPSIPGQPDIANDSEPSTFRSLITRHIIEANQDQENNESLSVSTAWTPIRIDELFDFKTKDWSDQYGFFANFSYEEELSLYDLLEKDTGEDGDLEPEIDATTQDVLLS